MTKDTKLTDQNILITSKDFTHTAYKYYLQFTHSSNTGKPDFDLVIEADECIDASGNVTGLLVEAEINRILRLVFRAKNANIFVCFKNSDINPLHEKTIVNLLRTAGYQDVYTSHLSEQLVRLKQNFVSTK
jgi:N-methylhydantoinase A/oxoprolinase/acetone carboxylase beta subunit